MTSWQLPEIDLARCNRCGLCLVHCPTAALSMTAAGPVITQPERCTYCTVCEAICPQQAIRCRFEIVWEQVS